MKTFYQTNKIGNITYYLIISPEKYSIFNTVCFSKAEAEIVCSAIDEIIMRIVKFELLKEMEKKHFIELRLFIDGLKELEELEKKQKIMKEINEWLDNYFNELQESLRCTMH